MLQAVVMSSKNMLAYKYPSTPEDGTSPKSGLDKFVDATCFQPKH